MIAGYVMGARAAARASSMGVVADAIFDKGSVAEVDAIEARIERLLLVTEALWTLLKQHGHTDEELAAIIAQLDGADADGKRNRVPTTCAGCGSKVAAGLAKCQICGRATGVVLTPLDQV